MDKTIKYFRINKTIKRYKASEEIQKIFDTIIIDGLEIINYFENIDDTDNNDLNVVIICKKINNVTIL